MRAAPTPGASTSGWASWRRTSASSSSWTTDSAGTRGVSRHVEPASEDADPLVLVEPHGVVGLDAERLVELRHVAHGVAAHVLRRVGVDGEQTDGLGLARLAPPHLRPPDEEALRSGETVDLGHAVALRRDAVGGVADLQTTEVADVLADGQAAVDLVVLGQARWSEGAELLDESLRQRVEPLAVGLRPPVAQATGAVVARTLVIEAVTELVADHGADAAVVDGVVGLEVEERRLQDRGREDDLVHR